MSELAALQQQIAGLQIETTHVREKLDDVVVALRELVRIDGDVKRYSDALVRIGRQVDDHDERIRAVEIKSAGTDEANKAKVHHLDRNVERFISIGVTIATGVIVWMVTRV
jgi:hypothetical protein